MGGRKNISHSLQTRPFASLTAFLRKKSSGINLARIIAKQSSAIFSYITDITYPIRSVILIQVSVDLKHANCKQKVKSIQYIHNQRKQATKPNKTFAFSKNENKENNQEKR